MTTVNSPNAVAAENPSASLRICVLGKADVPACNLVNALAAEGHEVHLFSAIVEENPDPRVTLHSIETRRKLQLLLSSGRIRDRVTRLRPDIVHAFFLTSYGFLASRIRGIPVVATAMGTDVFSAPELSSAMAPVRRALTRAAIRRADCIHSVAPHMTRRLIELGAPAERIRTFPRGIPTERFHPGPETPPAGPPYAMICNRRLEPIYDHETLLRGLHGLPADALPARLTILGRGSRAEPLQELARALDLHETVQFRDPVPHQDVPHVLREAPLFVSASLSDGTSACLLEAMACGCVPIVTDIPANRMWVEDGTNGYLFTPGDPSAFAGAVRRALADRDRWPALARSNFARIEREASLRTGCRRVLDLYAGLLGRPDAAPAVALHR